MFGHQRRRAERPLEAHEAVGPLRAQVLEPRRGRAAWRASVSIAGVAPMPALNRSAATSAQREHRERRRGRAASAARAASSSAGQAHERRATRSATAMRIASRSSSASAAGRARRGPQEISSASPSRPGESSPARGEHEHRQHEQAQREAEHAAAGAAARARQVVEPPAGQQRQAEHQRCTTTRRWLPVLTIGMCGAISGNGRTPERHGEHSRPQKAATPTRSSVGRTISAASAERQRQRAHVERALLGEGAHRGRGWRGPSSRRARSPSRYCLRQRQLPEKLWRTSTSPEREQQLEERAAA